MLPNPEPISFSDRREILEANLARQNEAIRASDAKITLLVPTTTAMLGILAALFRLAPLTPNASVLVAVSTLPLILAYALMAIAIIPRFRGGSSPVAPLLRRPLPPHPRRGPRRPPRRRCARPTSPTSPSSAR